MISFYFNADLRVKCGEFNSKTVDVTLGFLQGDSFHQLLFIRFLADVVKLFRKAGMKGVLLNAVRSLIMLLLADGTVIFATSWHDAHDKINFLK